MHTSTTVKISRILAWIVVFILMLLPFHAFLTVWLASAVGHYTLLRLWKEFLLLIALLGVIFLLFLDKQLRKKIFSLTFVRLIGAYTLLTVIWGTISWLTGAVTAKALGYGLIVNLRFLLFFILTLVVATKSRLLARLWPKLLFIPAVAVVLIGLLQRFIFPYDVLKHFGYGPDTIYAYQVVNHNIHYPRIMSTLRGANPLGAYLVLILSSLTVLITRARKNQLLLWGAFILAAEALIFSYSRGAWAGLLLSMLLLLGISIKDKITKKLLVVGLVVVLAIGIPLAYSLRHNPAFERAFLHTDKYSQVQKSSNQEHISSFKSGLSDALNEPLGRGAGTAGPASVYNNGKSRIAENYFTQIGQELGWLGLALFIAINFMVARELWFRKNDSLALILLVSFVGITAINLVSHAWTDDTLAYIWWGLAGICLSYSVKSNINKPSS